MKRFKSRTISDLKVGSLLAILLTCFLGCNLEEINSAKVESAQADLKSGRIVICHYSADDNIWNLLTVSPKSWAEHVLHGDVRLDDQDEDGYVPDNACGYGNMGDEDDTNACVNPLNPSSITNIRLGGQTGDNYIGPTCNVDGTYRTCFYVSGTDLPNDISKYNLKLNDVEHTIAFFQFLSSTEVVVCADDLDSCEEGGIDVSLQVTECPFVVNNLYEAPTCGGEITNARLGGQTGDNFIGPLCNNDGSYRTCYYLTGSDLPTEASGYHVTVNDVEYPVAFIQTLSPTEVVICLREIDGCDDGSTNVSIQTSPCSIFEAADLYDAPDCELGVTEIRLGGQTGDNFIGAVCNSDATYRSCYYLSGTDLPNDMSDYELTINGVEYPIAFFQALSSDEVVICYQGLDSCVEGSIDVSLKTSECTTFEAQDLYEAPPCQLGITNIRLGGQTGDNFIGAVCNQDGTYRACFYVEGSNLPSNQNPYHLKLNEVEYPIAFFQAISPDQVVVCVRDIPDIGSGVDVSIYSIECSSFDAVDLFDSPNCTPALRLADDSSSMFTYSKNYPEVSVEMEKTVQKSGKDLFMTDSYDSNRELKISPYNYNSNDDFILSGSTKAVESNVIKKKGTDTTSKWLVQKN